MPVDEVADVIPESLNESGLKTAFLFATLYFTVTVVDKPELASITTVSLSRSPCVAVPTTDTRFLLISPVITGYWVFKLWLVPTPTFIKYIKLWVPRPATSLIVAPKPTKPPVLPIPILTVDNPIKSLDILPTNNGAFWNNVSSFSGTARWNFTLIAVSLVAFSWYVTISPVSSPWSGKYIALDGMNICVLPAPGFDICLIVPTPTAATSAGVDIPTASAGLK